MKALIALVALFAVANAVPINRVGRQIGGIYPGVGLGGGYPVGGFGHQIPVGGVPIGGGYGGQQLSNAGSHSSSNTHSLGSVNGFGPYGLGSQLGSQSSSSSSSYSGTQQGLGFGK